MYYNSARYDTYGIPPTYLLNSKDYRRLDHNFGVTFTSSSKNYINFGDLTRLKVQPPVTIMFWLKCSTPNIPHQPIFASGNQAKYTGYLLCLQSTNNFYAQMGNNIGAGSTARRSRWAIAMTANDNTWHHYTSYFSASNAYPNIYVDGVLNNGSGSGTSTTTVFTTANTTIGVDTVTYYSNVTMSNFMFFNRALTVNEIRHYMYNEPSNTEKSLLAYFPMNEGCNTKIRDYSLKIQGTFTGSAGLALPKWSMGCPKIRVSPK